MAPVTSMRAVVEPDTREASADIIVEGLTKRFGETTAVEPTSFSIERGKFVGLIGPSGCGKSSLLMMLAGLLSPTEGTINLRGRQITKPDPAAVGVVFQDASLLPWKTAAENIQFPLMLRGMPPAERKERADHYLELVGLAGFGKHYPHELSGGMRQRIAIARGLCQDPEVLLMDEPFAALDEQTRTVMGDELLHIWEKDQKTVVFVTHSLTEAVYLCDEVLVMSARPGRIVKRIQIGLPRPRTYEMMATETFGKLRNEIWQLIRHA